MSPTKTQPPAETGGPCPEQIEIEALFAAQEREKRRRTGWIAMALVGVVAAGAVTGGAVTGAFSGDDETTAAGGNQDLGTSATTSEENPNAEAAGADVEASASPEADVPEAAAAAPEAEPAPAPEAAPAPETAPAPEASVASSYTVSSGDSLWSITQTALAGSSSPQAIVDSWPTIYQANQEIIGGDPSILRVGQQLTVPSLTPVSVSTGAGDATAPSPATTGSASTADSAEAGAGTHVVAPGESLWSITDAALGGNATADQVLDAWPAIYEANRQVIGDDPDVIIAGQQLSIPALG